MLLRMAKNHALRSMNNRHRITNGASFGPAGDGRTSTGRRWRDLHAELAAEIGRPLSPSFALLLRRLVTLCVNLERLEDRLSDTGDFDEGAYARLAAESRLLMTKLGLGEPPAPPAPPKAPAYRRRPPQPQDDHLSLESYLGIVERLPDPVDDEDVVPPKRKVKRRRLGGG